MKTKKLIIILLTVQLLLSWVSFSTDMEKFIDYGDVQCLSGDCGLKGKVSFNLILDNIIFIPLFIIGWSIFSGIFVLLLNKNNIFDFISKFSFFTISSLNILALLYFSFRVLAYGPLTEAFLTFMYFPIFGFFVFVGAIVLGVITFLVKKKLREKN